MDLESDHGDPIILLNAFKQWLELKSDGQNTNTRQWCKRRGFEEQRFYEMTKLRRQFKDLLDVNILLNLVCLTIKLSFNCFVLGMWLSKK